MRMCYFFIYTFGCDIKFLGRKTVPLSNKVIMSRKITVSFEAARDFVPPRSIRILVPQTPVAAAPAATVESVDELLASCQEKLGFLLGILESDGIESDFTEVLFYLNSCVSFITRLASLRKRMRVD